MRFDTIALVAVLGAGVVPSGAASSVTQPATLPPSTSGGVPAGYEPVGARVGSFVILPEIELLLGYDDNVLTQSDDEEDRDPNALGADDAFATVAARVAVNSEWRRHRVEGRAFARHTAYLDWPSENATEAGGRVEGVYDISRRSAVRAHVSADLLSEDRTSVGYVDQARSPSRLTRVEMGATYFHDFDPLLLEGELLAQRVEFHDATSFGGERIEQDYRDTDYWRGAVQASYDVSPGIAALVRTEIDRLDYRSQRPGNPLKRGSTGFKIEAGTKLLLTQLITGELRAGYLSRTSDDPNLPDPSGVSIGGAINWRVTPLTTLDFSADRAIEEGGSELTIGNLRTQGRVMVEHELRRNIVLVGRARVARIETVGLIDEEASEYQLDATARYLANRNLRLFARAERYVRSTDGTFLRDFERNRVSLGVAWEF